MRTGLNYCGIFVVIWGLVTISAEGVFRLIGDTPSRDMGGLYEQFQEDGYKLAPNVETGANWATGPFTVYTDELGFRCDAERKYGARSGSEIDILFLGDSQAFGNGVDYEATIPGTVAQFAERERLSVGNASVGGHHPPNQFAIAKWLRDEQQINVRRYVLLLTPVSIASCDIPTRALVGADGNLYGKNSGPAVRFRTWLKTHIVIYSRFRDALRSTGIGTEANTDNDSIYRLYSSRPDGLETNTRKWVEFLRKIKSFAAETGAIVEIVYLPLTLEASFDAIQENAETRGINVDPQAPFQVLFNAAKAVDIPIHDLRPVIMNCAKKGEELSLWPDFHYTGSVSKQCGKFLWDQL